MRKALILVVLALAAAGAPAGAMQETPPFPAGACVRATVLSTKPICVMVDPTR